uniref:NS3 n=1 Tax=uncultured densovirus TaxID=748192 RepID=A0A7L7YTK7_9VIRU|nr:NS3 [uncultured densovirus]
MVLCPFGNKYCVPCKCPKCSMCMECRGNKDHVDIPCFESYSVDLSAEGESLPTPEEEDEMSAVQPSTPISATALFKDPEYAELGEYFKFVTVVRYATVQDGNYEANQQLYQYLSEYVKREQFKDMYDQFGDSMVYNSGPYRLRTPVIAKDHKIKHLLCGEEDKTALKGIITVHSTSRQELIELIKDDECYFFCDTCGFFLFPEIEFMSDRVMDIPDFYPTCENHYMSIHLDEDNCAIVQTTDFTTFQYYSCSDDDCFFDTPAAKRQKVTHE